MTDVSKNRLDPGRIAPGWGIHGHCRLRFQGASQKAGESIDKGIQNAKDTINPPGPGEKVGREVDKAIKP